MKYYRYFTNLNAKYETVIIRHIDNFDCRIFISTIPKIQNDVFFNVLILSYVNYNWFRCKCYT